jgi:succinate dehydrogenase / fumarate reductase flavoprotein subunit
MSQRQTTHTASVLVIGSGAAGLSAAISAHEQGQEVLLVGKRVAGDAHTVLASGGINGVLATVDPEDSIAQHEADTLEEGYWLADPQIVETMAEQSPAAIHYLRQLGVRFAEQEDGQLLQRFFGAHKYRRTCFSGDYTGREIQLALVRRAKELGIPFLGPTYITRLLISDHGAFGAYGFDLESGERRVLLADAVILAAGGHTRCWRVSSSRRDENTGDAFRLALTAGCKLRDMEMVQFHPTGMAYPETVAGTLVTEAVRGEGGILTNAQGQRYMEKYDPDRLELSSRDRIALANYTEIAAGRGGPNGGVFLDISHHSRDFILSRLPRMYRQWIDAAMLDITVDKMEVAPTAHYSMGGIETTGQSHETEVRSLWAVGECAAGLHGANRLGGNSLAECLVFGRLTGRAAAERSREMSSQRQASAVQEAADEVDAVLEQRGEFFARPLQRAVRDTMWETCGVVRSEEKLTSGLAKLAELEARLPAVESRPDIAGFDDLAHYFDLCSMIISSRATIISARERRESRGAHQRSDFAATQEQERSNIIINADGETARRQIAAARPEVLALSGTKEEAQPEQLLE